MRVALVLGLLPGCAIVSGLDGIKVTTGDAAIAADASGADSSMFDSGTPNDSGGTDFALDFQNTCATGSTMFSFSNQSFTVSFWLKAGIPPVSNELKPYIYNGGRNASDPGWSIGVNGPSLVFCAGDGSVAPICAAAQGIMAVQHLLHVVGVSNAQGMLGKRDLALYALDVNAGNTSHQLIASTTGAPVAWQTQTMFGVGGQPTNNGCANTLPGIIDDLRVWIRALTAQELDQNYKVPIPCQDPLFVGNFTFDEGMGTTTANQCGALKASLNIGMAKWTPSPFP